MLGSSAAITAGFRIVLRDDYTKKLRIAQRQTREFSRQYAKSMQAMRTERDSWGGKALIAGAITVGMFRAAKAGSKYLQEMKAVEVVTKATTSQMAKLDAQAKKLAGNTIFRSKGVMSAAKYAAKSGQSMSTIQSSLAPATYLAAATETQLGGKGGTMDILTNIQKGFGIADSGIKEAADALTVATLSSNTSLTDLGIAIKYSAATAVDLGTSMKTTTAMLMVLGDTGFQGSRAGTGVENLMRYFSRAVGSMATSNQRNSLATLGYKQNDFKNADGSLKKWVEIFTMINKGAAKLTKTDRQDALLALFGVRGKKAASPIIRNISKLERFQDLLGGSGGAAKSNAEMMMNTLAGDFERASTAIDNFKVAFAEAVSPLMRGVLSTFTSLLKGINTALGTIPGKLIASISLLAAATLTVITSFKFLAIAINMARNRLMGASVGSRARGIPNIGSSPMQFGARNTWGGASALSGTNTRYSSKSGRFYNVGGQRTAGASKYATFDRSYMSGSLRGASSPLKSVAKGLGTVGMFFGRFLPIVGGVLTALTILDALFPDLISSIGSWMGIMTEQQRLELARYEELKKSTLISANQMATLYADTDVKVLVAAITDMRDKLVTQGMDAVDVANMTNLQIMQFMTNHNNNIPQTN